MERIRNSLDLAPRLLFNHIEEDVLKKEEFIMSQKQIYLNLVETYNLQLSQISIMNAFEQLMSSNGLLSGTRSTT